MADTPAREQKAFTWKAGYREAVEPKFEAWAETQQEGKKAFQDYILYLQTKADAAGSQDVLEDRIAALGIAPLVEMHRRRAEADVRMLEQIADLLEDARAKAMAEVQETLTALQKSADSATAITEDLRADKKNLEAQLAEKTEALEAAKAQNAALIEKLQEVEKAKAATMIRLGKTEEESRATAAALESARDDLNAARAELNTEREKALALMAEKDRFALDLKKAEQEIEAERRNTARLEILARDFDKKAAELKAIERALMETKIIAASHEATAKAQAETIATLQKALETLRRKEEATPQSKKARNAPK